MGLHGVTQPVNALQRSIAGGIVADGVSRAGNVIVNGAGNANNGDAAVGQAEQSFESTVTAYANQGVKA